MNEIKNFREIRADNKVIYDVMNIIELNWKPCKIKTVQWEYHGKLVEFKENPEIGVFADYLKDKDIVVFSRTIGSEEIRNYLTVYNPDGSIRFSIPNKILIFGEEKEGKFLGITEYQYEDDNHFVIIFEPDDYNAMYYVLVNCNTGATECLSEAR